MLDTYKKTLKDEEKKTDKQENSGPKERHGGGEFSSFSYCLIYSKIGVEKFNEQMAKGTKKKITSTYASN
jgi:hypothetical protein